jgi:hypothetical protein
LRGAWDSPLHEFAVGLEKGCRHIATIAFCVLPRRKCVNGPRRTGDLTFGGVTTRGASCQHITVESPL